MVCHMWQLMSGQLRSMAPTLMNPITSSMDGEGHGGRPIDPYISNGFDFFAFAVLNCSAFNWESHKYGWWKNLEKKVAYLARCGLTSAWLPPATHSFSPEGYLPQNLYSLDSYYGSHLELKALLQKLNQHKVRAMADIVTNYRVGTTRGHGGAYNQYDRIPLSWNEHSVTSCCGELSSLLISMYRSTGDNFHGVPNIDHTQAFVWKDIIGWLKWLLKSIGFQDFRFDFAKGYAPKFVKEYVEESKPMFFVGEYWDTCNYSPDYCFDYNQGQTISASMTTVNIGRS
ncbi:probable alpha-amylase 2 [Phoenix dactylifera]|uniref:1,4-alpha-D-glucan glucanohydrolase n=1 Tax=Phoenix dactylifera TaxID=42345 RepID=A0A8B9A009_PHODC|nr:probable alpha-amylase 2 [Phoenix dactylifera]